MAERLGRKRVNQLSPTAKGFLVRFAVCAWVIVSDNNVWQMWSSCRILLLRTKATHFEACCVDGVISTNSVLWRGNIIFAINASYFLILLGHEFDWKFMFYHIGGENVLYLIFFTGQHGMQELQENLRGSRHLTSISNPWSAFYCWDKFVKSTRNLLHV